MQIAALTSRVAAAAIDMALFMGAFFVTGLVTVFAAAALDGHL